MKKAWKPFGIDLTIHTFKVDSIIKRGTSNKSLAPDERNFNEE